MLTYHYAAGKIHMMCRGYYGFCHKTDCHYCFLDEFIWSQSEYKELASLSEKDVNHMPKTYYLRNGTLIFRKERVL